MSHRLNNSCQDALSLIEQSHYILIVTHINPDADTISCALALSNYFFDKRIKHKVYNSAKQLPQSLKFLPKFSKIVHTPPKSYDLVIFVDCGDKKRVGIEIEDNCKIINIDHHHSNDYYGTINIIDDTKSSTAEVLYQFFKANKISLTKNIATCLYIGIYDDSVGFTTPRTNKETFLALQDIVQTGIDIGEISQNYKMQESLAKYRLLPKILESLELHCEGRVATIYQKQDWLYETGAGFNECDEMANEILKIAVVQIVIYLRENNEIIRVSLRGKETPIDLSKFAESFNGGGHKNAAGLSLYNLSLVEGKKQMVSAIQKYI